MKKKKIINIFLSSLIVFLIFQWTSIETLAKEDRCSSQREALTTCQNTCASNSRYWIDEWDCITVSCSSQLEDYSQCELTKNIWSEKFSIPVASFSPWGSNFIAETSKGSGDKTLWALIAKMLVLIWSLSVLVMVVWWWYMIAYSGQDELLSKWKSIFTAGMISLIIALWSYFMVALVRFMLYS